MMKRQQVCFGDTIQFRVESNDVIGVFDCPELKYRPVTCVPPVKPGVKDYFTPSRFTVTHPNGITAKTQGEPVRYGDSIVLIDQNGLVWNNKIGSFSGKGFIGPRPRQTRGEMHVTIKKLDPQDKRKSGSGSKKSSGAGDTDRNNNSIINYGDEDVVIEVVDSHRYRESYNHRLSRFCDENSLSDGGFLVSCGSGEPITFAIHHPDTRATVSVNGRARHDLHFSALDWGAWFDVGPLPPGSTVVINGLGGVVRIPSYQIVNNTTQLLRTSSEDSDSSSSSSSNGSGGRGGRKRKQTHGASSGARSSGSTDNEVNNKIEMQGHGKKKFLLSGNKCFGRSVTVKWSAYTIASSSSPPSRSLGTFTCSSFCGLLTRIVLIGITYAMYTYLNTSDTEGTEGLRMSGTSSFVVSVFLVLLCFLQFKQSRLGKSLYRSCVGEKKSITCYSLSLSPGDKTIVPRSSSNSGANASGSDSDGKGNEKCYSGKEQSILDSMGWEEMLKYQILEGMWTHPHALVLTFSPRVTIMLALNTKKH